MKGKESLERGGGAGGGGGEISKQEYNPGKMTTPEGMGRIVITFRWGGGVPQDERSQVGIDSRYVFFLCDV